MNMMFFVIFYSAYICVQYIVLFAHLKFVMINGLS